VAAYIEHEQLPEVQRVTSLTEQKWNRNEEVNARNLLNKLERETGIGPATSRLGYWLSIENKEYSVYGVDRCLYRAPGYQAPTKIDFLRNRNGTEAHNSSVCTGQQTLYRFNPYLPSSPRESVGWLVSARVVVCATRTETKGRADRQGG